MGFLKPTVRLDQPTPHNEVGRLQDRAKLPKSNGAGLLQLAGIVLIILSVLALAVNPLGLLAAVSGAIGGGLIWAAGTITQLVFDLRTLALREFDRSEAAMLESAE